MTIDEQIAHIKRGCVDLVNEAELKQKLESGKTLRVKLGADPTSADLHLGHSVVLNKMRAFQDLGHIGVLVIGDFTASIGDPSGRDKTRPVLSIEKIRENAETYAKQAFKILDPKKTEIRYNSEWLVKFAGSEMTDGHFSGGTASPMLSALAKVTVSRLLERDDFKKRMAAGSPISMLEVLYPVFQGYDSVALEADVELGGADQIFNLLMGRDLQKDYGQKPQVVLTVPLILGTDGVKKMSKSYGNYVGLSDAAGDMFGKMMSVSDSLMLNYYELLTSEDLAAVKAMHPMEAKKRLAALMVERFHGAEAAIAARAEFEKVFSKKQLPDDMPEVTLKDGVTLCTIIFESGFAPSKREARRLVDQGAVRLDGEKLTQDGPLSKEGVLQVGRRHFCRLKRG